MAKPVIVVTGDKQLDRAFRRFANSDTKGARRAIRRAAKKSNQDHVLADYRRLVPEKSGAMKDAAKVRAIKRSRSRIGSRVVIDRNKLFQLYQARTGELPTPRTQDDEPFFYPIMVEFGEPGEPGERPMREALYGNHSQVFDTFKRELRKEVALAGKL